MMKKNDAKKITTLGVVIFSFLAVLITVALVALFGAISALLVLKTDLPESVMRIGCVMGSGIGVVLGTAIMTAIGRVRGIISSGIVFSLLVLLKTVGKPLLGLGGFFTLNGFLGIVFLAVFALAGGVVGGIARKQ
ncbi:MAG: hypothetical protein IJD09_01215 [Clostridia bacterium]|nr:hypothetical protein [Clostridia bacterium]